MANTKSQAEAIRDLLVERLEQFDASLDVSEGSALWTQVVEPLFQALGTDPFDTDIRTFLKDRVTQAFPLVSAQDGDSLVDLLITPLEVLLEPLKREQQIVRRGQSARHPELMRLEDARDLAANFFVEWRSGRRASGVQRVYFAAPTYLTILPTVEFSTAAGLKFYPTSPLTIRPEQMILYHSGTEYYVDVQVTAAETGVAYNVPRGTISHVRGITGYTRLTNLAVFEDGLDAETVDALLARVRASLTERTLNVRRGIVARVRAEFASISDVEVVGFGDPEMNRDVLTGGGEGSVIASGVCFVVGQFVLMFSMFEDRGPEGTTAISVGDEVELNFWRFLYDTDGGSANEKFTVDTILFDSRNAVVDAPSVLLFRISSVPSVTQPIAGTLPGVLPGVFAVVRGPGKLEVSDIPGGILSPVTLRGTVEVDDGEVHIGGHYDVWVRATAPTTGATTFDAVRSAAALVEGTDLVVSGESVGHRHLVHRAYTVSSTTVFALGASLSVAASGARAVVARVTVDGATRVYDLWEMNGVEFAVADSVTDGALTGVVSAVSAQAWDGAVERGMVLSLPRGNEEGSYRILLVDGPFLYLDVALTTSARAQHFRVLGEVSVDLFNPRAVSVPFGAADGTDMRTTIGSALLRTTVNLQEYGAAVGDTVELLEGDDRGTYVIQSWDGTFGGSGPVVGARMTATNSGLAYTVYRATGALPRPLLRIKPDGVALLDAAGQDSGYRVPYALPVDVRARGAFSGSGAVATGLNGFVLMDPGSGWAPSADYATDISTFDWATYTGGDFEDFYTAERFRRCYTDECVTSDGYIAVISVYGGGQMFLDSNLPVAAQSFLSSARAWLLSVISTFNFGGDEEELVTAFSPLVFGPNTDSDMPLLLQFEILIPFAVFDGCNNVFVALPEFDWENEFAAQDNFGDAIGRFNDGALAGRDPRLLLARPGDVLTVLSGQNAGAYVIDSVHQYYLINGGALMDGGGSVNLDNSYKVALVVIRDEFPVPALGGLAEFFADGSATWSLPAVPALPFTVTDNVGDTVDGWDWVETVLTWFFQLLTSMGFDLPSNVSLDVPETLKAFWQLLFNAYVVGRPTAPQYLRMYFQEPTSVTVHAPQVCGRYQWSTPEHSAVVVVGALFTLPLPDLVGVTAALTLESLGSSTTLSSALPAAGTAETIGELAVVLQDALDPSGTYVTFSGPATATGNLTVTTVSGGVDHFLYITADTGAHAFRWMGFFRSTGKYWAELESVIDPVYLAQHVTLAALTGFSLNAYTDWSRLTVSTTKLTVSGVVGTFVDGDGLTDGTGATANYRVVGTTLYIYDIGGSPNRFEPGHSVTSGGGATATIDTVTHPTYTEAETITGGTSAATGTANKHLIGLDVAAGGAAFANNDTITGPSGSGRVRTTGTANRLLIYDVVGTFAYGDTVTGAPSGASKKVEEVQSILVVKDASSGFSAGELVTGGTSGTVGYLLALEDPYIIVANVALTAGTTLTHDEVAEDIEEVATALLVEYLVDDAVVTVVFEEVTAVWGYTVTLAGDGLVEFALLAPISFEAVTDKTTVLFGGTVPVDGSLSVRGAEPDAFFIADLEAETALGLDTYTLATTMTYAEACSFDAAVDAAAAGDFDDLAAALNAFEDAYSDGVERRVWFVGGATELTVRAVVGGTGSIAVTAAGAGDGYFLLGYTGDTEAEGTDAPTNAVEEGATVPGETETVYWHPPAPTVFVAAAGALELLFVPALDADAHQVFPGTTDGSAVDVVDLPRDVVVGAPYAAQNAAELAFTDAAYGAPVALDFREGEDWVHIYAQRVFLEHTDYTATDTDASPDRVVAVLTAFGSNVVTLPDFVTDEFTFLAPNSGLDDDQAQVGDVVFVEEGEDTGGYRVVERSASALTLDRPLSSSTERVYRVGNDGALVVHATDAKFTSADANFVSDDVGRYLTVWACNRAGEDGSYAITAVEADGSGCTLDTAVWAESETDVHWAVVRAPVETLEASGTGGRTALLGLRPLRVYNGEPAEFRVARVSPGLDRAAARVTVTLDADGAPPRRSTLAPYRVVRPGAQHISSTAMAAQVERGLFYFDVLAHSLGGDDVYNVPENTKLEPVFGTYESDGYRVDVADNRYAFSTREESSIVFTPSFLPRGLDDQLVNQVTLDGRSLLVSHESAPVVAQVQSLLSSETDRVLCSNALARHFLPAYVYLDMPYSGGNSSASIATALHSYIDGLSAVDELDVSRLEKVLHRNGVTRYDHPVRVATLTHDLDRRIVGTQSDNAINDDEIAYNGTNRTTFFIAGPDQSAVENAADVPPGERIRLTRTVTRSTFR